MAQGYGRLRELRWLYRAVQIAVPACLVLCILLMLSLGATSRSIARIADDLAQPDALQGLPHIIYVVQAFMASVAVFATACFVSIVRRELHKSGQQQLEGLGTSYWWLWCIVPIVNLIVPPLCIAATLRAVGEPAALHRAGFATTALLIVLWWSLVAVAAVHFGEMFVPLFGSYFASGSPLLYGAVYIVALALLMLVMRWLMRGYKRYMASIGLPVDAVA